MNFGDDVVHLTPQEVSIHIRHCWRMNFVSLNTELIMAGFNPHSPLLANELFNLDACAHVYTSFNPHSPLLANELARYPAL